MRSTTYKCDRCASNFTTEKSETPAWLHKVKIEMTGYPGGGYFFDLCHCCAHDLTKELQAFVEKAKATVSPVDRIKEERSASSSVD